MQRQNLRASKFICGLLLAFSLSVFGFNLAATAGEPSAGVGNSRAVSPPSCGEVVSREDISFCREERATKAAELQAKWGFWQIIIGASGTVLVVATLFFTARAAISAERAARAAQEAVNHSAETAMRQLRAYIFVDTHEIFEIEQNLFETGNFPTGGGVRLIVKNSGQTPAGNYAHWSMMTIKRHEEEWSLMAPDFDDSTQAIMPPGGLLLKDVPFDDAVTAGDLADWHAGLKNLYVYGSIIYTDAFEFKRRTNYRFYYEGVKPISESGRFILCNVGNEAS